MNNQICNKEQGYLYPSRMSEFAKQIMRQYPKLLEQHPEYFRCSPTDVQLGFLSDSVVRSLASRVQKYRSVTMNLGERIRLKMSRLVPNPETSTTDRDLSKGLFNPILPHDKGRKIDIPIVVNQPNQGAAQRFDLRPVRLPVGAIAVQHIVPAPPRLLPARIPNETPQRVRHLPEQERNLVPLFPAPRQIQPVGRPPAAVRLPPPQQRELGPARGLQQDTLQDFATLRPIKIPLYKKMSSTASRQLQRQSDNRSGLNSQVTTKISIF